jgi:hypothetical protein
LLHFKKLEPFDKWSIGLYLVLTVSILYLFGPTAELIFWYGLLTQFSLYAFCYMSLRNLTAYLIWLAIGLFHLYLYTSLNDLGFQMDWEHGATPLRNTAALLVLFQVLRFVSIRIQQQDLVLPTKVGGFDLYDEREVNWTDVVLFLIYIACMVGLNFL